MRCKLTSTRLFRSDPAKERSTESGPGRCKRSLETLGFAKPSRYSAFAPKSCSMLPVAVVAINLLYELVREPAEELLRSPHVAQDLGLQLSRIFEFPLVADALQKFHANLLGCVTFQRIQQEGFDGKRIAIAEGRPVSDIGDRIPRAPVRGAREIDSPGRQHWRGSAQIQGWNRLLCADAVA